MVKKNENYRLIKNHGARAKGRGALSSLFSLVIGKPITVLISVYSDSQPAGQPEKQTWLWRSHHDLKNRNAKTETQKQNSVNKSK